jgi:hypothetical protein
MFRKTLIAIAAAATLAVGMVAATAPAEAGHRRHHIGVYLGLPFVGVYHGHRRHNVHCHTRKVRHHGHWKRVRVCHQHGYHTY